MNSSTSLRSLSKDIPAGLLVSLIALPLSMGIAMASGFPASSGLIAAIVGGVITTFIGGARLSIKGPAAGLIVIVLGAVQELAVPGDPMSGPKRAAAVVIVAGALQVIMGLTRCGVLADLMPVSVVHGMLAAIGIIIVGKQLHVLMGVVPEGHEPLQLILEIPKSAAHLNPEILLIGLMSFGIMWFHQSINHAALKRVPGVLFVMIAAIALGLVFDLSHLHPYNFFGGAYSVGPNYLVHLPASLKESIFVPDWSVVTSAVSLKYILFFTIIGSIESLLTVSAVNSLDPEHRRASPDRDLIALGIGNMLSGALGGLPMISEIVRSKANIDSGAKSGCANMSHGLFLLVFLAVLSPVLSLVPVSALAGVLVYVGLRLASPKEFSHAYHSGPEQFVFFVVTCFLTIATDLLIGVGVGLVCAVAFKVWKGTKMAHFLTLPVDVEQSEEDLKLKVKGNSIFSNFPSLRRVVEENRAGTKRIVVDFSDAKLVDFAFLEKLDALQKELRDISIVKVGLERHRTLSHHPNATRLLPNDTAGMRSAA